MALLLIGGAVASASGVAAVFVGAFVTIKKSRIAQQCEGALQYVEELKKWFEDVNDIIPPAGKWGRWKVLIIMILCLYAIVFGFIILQHCLVYTLGFMKNAFYVAICEIFKGICAEAPETQIEKLQDLTMKQKNVIITHCVFIIITVACLVVAILTTLKFYLDKKNLANCTICHKRNRDRMFIPCGHLVSCKRCALNIRPPRICPKCHRNFTQIKRAYFT